MHLCACPADASDWAELLALDPMPYPLELEQVPTFVIAEAIKIARNTGHEARADFLEREGMSRQLELV